MKKFLIASLLAVSAAALPCVANPTPIMPASKAGLPTQLPSVSTPDLKVEFSGSTSLIVYVVNESSSAYRGSRTVTVSSTDAYHLEGGKAVKGFSQTLTIPEIPAKGKVQIKLSPAPHMPCSGMGSTYHFKAQLSRGDQNPANDSATSEIHIIG